MRWWRALRSLIKAPETLDPEDLRSYVVRKVMLRGIIAILVTPVVLAAVFGVPWVRSQWSRYHSPCWSLLDEASWAQTGLPALTETTVTHHNRVCRMEATFEPSGSLTIEFAERGYPIYVPKGELQTWDWERSEQVRWQKEPHLEFFHVILRDGRQLGIRVRNHEQAKLAPFVTRTMERVPKRAFRD